MAKKPMSTSIMGFPTKKLGCGYLKTLCITIKGSDGEGHV